MGTTVIVAGARTPIGKLLGGFANLSSTDLGGVAIAGALRKAGVSPEQVDYVILGQVLTAGVGQMPARQAAVSAHRDENIAEAFEGLSSRACECSRRRHHRIQQGQRDHAAKPAQQRAARQGFLEDK